MARKRIPPIKFDHREAFSVHVDNYTARTENAPKSSKNEDTARKQGTLEESLAEELLREDVREPAHYDPLRPARLPKKGVGGQERGSSEACFRCD